MVPCARVDKKEDGGEYDCKSEYKGEDGCPKDNSTPRIMTTDPPSHPIF